MIQNQGWGNQDVLEWKDFAKDFPCRPGFDGGPLSAEERTILDALQNPAAYVRCPVCSQLAMKATHRVFGDVCNHDYIDYSKIDWTA